MEDYIKALEAGNQLLENLGYPPTNQKEREAVATRIRNGLFPTGNVDPRFEKLYETYISKGLDALLSASASDSKI